jgi:type I restriction enzyme M protein
MATPTTAQSLGALLKSARDIMRKDKGLNGDLDRLPMLTWIMFLKFLDDLEIQREGEAKLAGKKFKPAIEAPYRWRDWAAKSDGITGDELLAFINNEETVVPQWPINGKTKRGPGLFRYLRTLTSSNGDDRREVIATVFKGVQNRMVSGYLLRDVINKLNGIHFTASDELHTLGALYESMLREMRDAAGDSGEFYTPRAVVRFMVTVTNPRLGERVMDPASGTGGFLVETFNHLSQQVKTVADRKILQEASLFGCEPKTLPYLLCQMNLLLHGLDAPQIDPGNSLRFKLTDIGERDRVDVILTNPPFGGEEEKGIQGNFPEDKQTSETAMLFLQLIMRKLRRQPHLERGSPSRSTLAGKDASGLSEGSVAGEAAAGGTPALLYARAAVVVPNGTLFGDGVCARIKEELLKEFNLHTIVRLPNGVFAPYTGIPTNLLFFDRSGPTREVWYYEQPLPEGRKNYTKTAPIQFEEFAPLIQWWGKREENELAWKVPAAELLANGCNLDRKNPRAKEDITHLPPAQLAGDILKKEQRIGEIMGNIQKLLAKSGS